MTAMTDKTSWHILVSPGLAILLLFLLIPANLQAACSSYKNRATINELHRQGNTNRFVEVKLLDTSINSSVWGNWTVTICSNAQGCTAALSLSDPDISTNLPYIVVTMPMITDKDYVDLTVGGGMDVILEDNSGKTIDYVSVSGYLNQQDASCTPAYDWDFPGSNSQSVGRMPDGSGDWTASGPGGSVPPTTGTPNDPLPGGLAFPTIDITNVTVSTGSTAVFTLTLSVPISDYPDQLTDFDITLDYETLDDTALAGTNYTYTSGSINFPVNSPDGDTRTISVNTVSDCTAGSDLYFWIFLDNQVNVSILNHFAVGTIQYPGGAAADHFDIDHDGAGISCLAEGPISVTVEDAANATITCYTGTITLDTGTGTGTWTLASGSGTFDDATANDGKATYAYVGGDLGTASFNLLYETGTSPVNISVTDGTANDDDLEGTISFSPSGFTVTASALANPPPNPINDPVAAQTAGTDFVMHMAAYGQTATDPVCGIIESYSGARNIKFWSTYDDPATGTIQVSVDANPIATTEAASASQAVTFTNGQANVTVKYKDVGKIQIDMKDDTVTEPVGGITGASNLFVVKPADFILTNINRTSDAFANPGAADENGIVFIKAGDDFTVTVTAQDAEGDATPNFGQETAADGVLLTPTIVTAGGANNPAIQFTTGFSFAAANGTSTGTDFSWGEVGIITLTPSIADADYLGTGDVTGTVSGNVGRFIPHHFTTAVTDGTFANSCGIMTYTGQDFSYLAGSEPAITITAEDAANNSLTNYAGVFQKLVAGNVSMTYPTADTTAVGADLITPMALTTTQIGAALSNGSPMDFSFGTDTYQYTRTLPILTDNALVTAFSCDLLIQLTATTDSDGVAANDLPKNITPSCAAMNIQYGRGTALNGFGSETEDMDVLLYTEYYSGDDLDGDPVWQINTDDNCATITYLTAATGITVTENPASPLAVASGEATLTLTPTADAGDPGGTVDLTYTFPSWLGPDPTAQAFFGLYRANDRIINWQEIVR